MTVEDDLFAAIRNGNRKQVETALARGAKPNVRGDYPPLWLAAFRGELAIVELLIARGAALNAWTPYEQSALSAAVIYGHTAVVKRLLAAGASTRCKRGAPLLHLAVQNGRIAIVRAVLDTGIADTRYRARTAVELATLLRRPALVAAIKARARTRPSSRAPRDRGAPARRRRAHSDAVRR